MPADGMSAAAEKQDFGTSRWAALRRIYTTLRGKWKGMAGLTGWPVIEWPVMAHCGGASGTGECLLFVVNRKTCARVELYRF
jgi:hypothetical protein